MDPGWESAEADMLYRLLENEVIPCFYDRDPQGMPRAWLQRVRASMAELAPRFSANRMLREYVKTYYAPMGQAYRRRAAHGARLASEIDAWRSCLDAHWRKLRFGDLIVRMEGKSYHFRVSVYLDDLSPDALSVELYAEASGGEPPVRLPMRRGEPLPGAVNGFLYDVEVESQRPVTDYTPRLLPAHPDVAIPIEASHVLWQK